jgi:hypothetical protein
LARQILGLAAQRHALHLALEPHVALGGVDVDLERRSVPDRSPPAALICVPMLTSSTASPVLRVPSPPVIEEQPDQHERGGHGRRKDPFHRKSPCSWEATGLEQTPCPCTCQATFQTPMADGLQIAFVTHHPEEESPWPSMSR